MPNYIYILAAIDGTGSRAEHDRLAGTRRERPLSERLSNTREFYNDFRTLGSYKGYFAGPDSWMWGVSGEIRSIIEQVNLFLWRAIANAEVQLGLASGSGGSQIKICLIGHSRGGLAAIEVARSLRARRGGEVYFWGLLDAVDRTRHFSGAEIQNVRHVYHARRNVALYEDWQGAVMDNTGTSSSDHSSEYHQYLIRETHGYIGWDARSAGNSWLRSQARRVGVPV